jgi:hypothetical protein
MLCCHVQVFCFQSGALGTAVAADTAPAAPTAAAANAASSSSSTAGGRVSQHDTDAASATDSPAAATQQASELASAVADMLNAAGMPLDLDKQQLLQTALAANRQLQQVRWCNALVMIVGVTWGSDSERSIHLTLLPDRKTVLPWVCSGIAMPISTSAAFVAPTSLAFCSYACSECMHMHLLLWVRA